MISGGSASIKLYSILKNIKELTDIVGDKIIPLDSKEEVNYPFVVFTRYKVEPVYTKDYLMFDNVYFDIAAVASNYLDGCKIVEIIRSYLECYHDDYIYHVTIEDITEDYIEYAYVQNLMVKIQIKPKKENK